MEHHDLIIVGGGPAGALAAILAAPGRSIALVEARTVATTKPCGEFLAPLGCAVLERAGLRSGIAARACPLGSLSLGTSSGRLFAPLPGSALGVRREVLDDQLLRIAAGRVTLYRGEPVVGITRVDGRWRIHLRQGPTLGANVLIGADGRHSRIRRWTGLGRTATTGRHALATRITGLDLPRHPQHGLGGEMHLGPFGQVGICPLAADEANLNLLLTPAGTARLGAGTWPLLRQAIATIPALAARVGDLRRTGPILAVGNLRQLARCADHVQGVALIGDAAICTDPFTGEGMSNALIDAELLAGCLADWPPGADPSPFLRDYAASHRRWHRTHRWETRLLPWLLDHPRLADLTIRAWIHLPGGAQLIRARHAA